MNSKIQISASLLSADFLHLEDDIRKSEEAGVSSFHLDVMDGHLAPNISYGPPIIKFIRKATKLPLIAHLMIDNPWLYLDDYIQSKVDGILLHAEAYDLEKADIKEIKTKARIAKNINIKSLKEDLEYIKKHGVEAGITLNPGTDITLVKPILGNLDCVLFMSVNPGFSGQVFMPEVLPKIQELRKIFKGDIKIDGGINEKTAKSAIAAGANILITASYLYSAKDYKAAIQKLLV
jgi:ribulose-phosphate 3-epimerase